MKNTQINRRSFTIVKLQAMLRIAAISRRPTAVCGIFAVILALAFTACPGDPPGGDDPVPVTGVTLNQTTLELTVGGAATLTATVAPADAANKAVTWTSSNADVATVSGGTVTGVSAGTATITVTTEDGGKTAACAVTVTLTGSSGGIEELPIANGVNALSGKTYFISTNKTVFSATAAGAADGTYAVEKPVWEDGYVLDNNDKYTYEANGNGTYTWNATAKIVTLKPEKIPEWDTTNSQTILVNESAYRLIQQVKLDGYLEIAGEDAFNEFFEEMGYSSVDDYLDDLVNNAFKNTTYTYSFSADGAALFLEEVLPANKGTNELSGQTYNGITSSVRDTDKVYVFTAAGYTFTEDYGGDSPYEEEGVYAYDSSNSGEKRVWFRPTKVYDMTRAEFYADTEPEDGHHFIDDAAYKASRINDYFSSYDHPYNSTNKTIGWQG